MAFNQLVYSDYSQLVNRKMTHEMSAINVSKLKAKMSAAPFSKLESKSGSIWPFVAFISTRQCPNFLFAVYWHSGSAGVNSARAILFYVKD